VIPHAVRKVKPWLVALVLVVSACTSGAAKRQALPTTVASTPPPLPIVTPHGDVAVGSEQEPGCLDWLSTCVTPSPGVFAVEANTLPRAYDFSADGIYKPSILITGEAGVRNNPEQMVTYNINPRAEWSDGQPITSNDFQYTWQQIVASPAPIDKSGYSRILTVDDTDPHTAIVTFSTPYPNWKQLFGGTYGIYPSHLLQNADFDTALKDGYTWSGGPWKIDHWSKGVELKLIPNMNYWGKKPDLNSVTIKFFTDPAAEQQAFQASQILALYPDAQHPLNAYLSRPGTSVNAVTGLSLVGLWFNVEQTPLNSKAVRQALAYATDRTTIAQEMFITAPVDSKPINSFFTPAYPKGYTEPFGKYHLDLTMVNTLMTGDGWAKGADGIWAKGVSKGVLTLKVDAANPSQMLAAQLLAAEWQLAGFQLTVAPEALTALHTDLTGGNFQVAVLAQTANDDDVGQCDLWCSKNIPKTGAGSATSGTGGSALGSGGSAVGAGGGVGGVGEVGSAAGVSAATAMNYARISDPTLDRLWTDADNNVDQNARLQDAVQGQAALADLVPAIPLVAVPDVLIVNTASLAVEGGQFLHNFVTGPYTYLSSWFLK
jgi:peptide/nickel transport system substrate-binding protein